MSLQDEFNNLKTFKEPEDLLEFLDKSFGDIADNFHAIIQSGSIENGERDVSIAMPIRMSALQWTKAVFKNWEDMALAEDDPGANTVAHMQKHFPGLAEAIAETYEFDIENFILPLDTEEGDVIDYFTGFEEGIGWKKLQAAGAKYGLKTDAFLAPIQGDQFGIGLVTYSEDGLSIKDKLEFGQYYSGTEMRLN
jgi:hypothetical protein